MDDRRLTAEASFYVAIQTVVARIQFAANEPEQSENHYESAIMPQKFVDIFVSYKVTGGVSMAFRTWSRLWTGAAINAGNGVK